jgi:hypothetical protein
MMRKLFLIVVLGCLALPALAEDPIEKNIRLQRLQDAHAEAEKSKEAEPEKPSDDTTAESDATQESAAEGADGDGPKDVSKHP